MTTPPNKGFFRRAFSELFGPGTPLSNEPTIDYNDTIRSFKHDDFSLHNNRNFRYGTIQDDDSDIELNHDLNKIYDQLNENSTKLSQFSLPTDYPGKFNSGPSFKPDRFVNNSDNVFLNPTPTPSYSNRYSAGVRPTGRFKSSIYDIPKYQPRDHTYDWEPTIPDRTKYGPRPTSYADDTFNRRRNYGVGTSRFDDDSYKTNFKPDTSSRFKPTRPTDYTLYNDKLERELRELQDEVNRESITKLNTKINHLDINIEQLPNLEHLVDSISRNNKTLSQLDKLIDVSEEADKTNSSNYAKLKQEMRQELLSHQEFYKSYISLVNKYRALKNSAPHTVQNDKIISRINLIKASTKENSVKLICNNLLNELNNNALEIDSLKSKLNAANQELSKLSSV